MTTDTVVDRLYSSAPFVGKSGRVFASKAGLSTVRNLREIEELIRRFHPHNTLEVGLAFGASALVFATVGQETSPGVHRHVAIDPFQNSVWDGVGMKFIEAAGYAATVDFKEEPSSLVLPRLLSEGQQFDLIYVDGSHLFEDVFIDAYYSARLLADHGFLLFDDSSDRHVAKTLNFIDNNIKTLERLPDHGLRHRVARMIGKRQLTIYQRKGPIERPWNSVFNRF